MTLPLTQDGQAAQKMMRYDAAKKSVGVAYLLWFFVGLFGGHRFYLGRVGTGITMLVISLLSFVLMFAVIGAFTIFITAIWAFVDAFLIPGMAQRHNERLIAQIG